MNINTDDFKPYKPISRIVLASSSPRRKELVAALDLSLPVYILSTNADESIEEGWTPRQTVEELSMRKAEAARDMLSARGESENEAELIIAADTIVVLGDVILGKPGSEEEAIAMLRSLSDATHEVYTGVACLATDSDKAIVAHRRTKVRMKALDEDRIRRYVATGEPMDKAGAYGIQGLGATLVDEIEGCYFNVVGLPLSLLSDMLEQFGVRTV